MVEGGGGGFFPVVFYDGEQDTNIGNVRIHPTLDFKTFRLILCQKIGVSPNQISIYLVDGKRPKLAPPEDSRRIPITGRVNFAVIAREKDCFFLVVLKPSRRDRRLKLKQNDVEGFTSSVYMPPENNLSPPPLPEKFVLLRRNVRELNSQQFSGCISPYYGGFSASELWDLNSRLQNFQIQRENYPTMMMKNSNSNPNFNSNSNSKFNSNSLVNLNFNTFTLRIEDNYANRDNQISCKKCADAKRKGKAAPFHCCVHDPMVIRFRSTFGPISRPSR